MAKLTLAQQLYRTFSTSERYAHVKWIANVLLSCSKPGTRLKGLKALVDAGHEVAALDFIMPYQGLRIDGKAYQAMPALDAAARGKVAFVAYTS
jgi:hypothetical protein